VVDRYWAEWLGCTVPDLRPTSTRVHAHGPGLADYDGTFVLLAGGAPVISLPPALVPALEPVARRWSAEQSVIPSPSRRPHLPVRDVARVVGPAWVGYADAGTLAAPAGVRARLLTGADAPQWRRCAPRAPPRSGSTGDTRSRRGPPPAPSPAPPRRFTSGPGRVHLLGQSPGPHQRGHAPGPPRARVRARRRRRAASHALEAGLVPQYRTLEANAAARALAASVGFAAHLTTVAVPYRVAQPRPAHGVAR
jgi:hypothetical protein